MINKRLCSEELSGNVCLLRLSPLLALRTIVAITGNNN